MSQVTPKIRAERRLRRKHHIRKRVQGTPEKPRLSIFRSLGHIYGQLVDDLAGRTLCAASTLDEDLRAALKAKGNCLAAAAVGNKLAEKAKSAGITRIVFDRNGFRYHGRVKAFADAARKGGLQF